MNTRIMVLFVLTGAMAAWSPSALGSQDMASVIATVKEHESLYDNLEVIRTFEYTFYQRWEASPDLLKRLLSQVRSVRQRGKFYSVEHAEGESLDRKHVSSVTTDAFDGAVTRRSFDSGAAGNIVREKIENPRLFIPHWALMQHNSADTERLSTFLSLVEQADAPIDVFWECEGDEPAEGLECLVVRADYKRRGTPGTAGHGLHQLIKVWLAKERNYIPARITLWCSLTVDGVEKFDQTRPVCLSRVLEWKEVPERGWIPIKTERVNYDEVRLYLHQEHVVVGRWVDTVDSINVNPNYPDELFTQVPFKAGAPIYEVENGAVVRSLIHPGGIDTATGRELWTRWLWGAVVTAVIVAGVWLIRVRTKDQWKPARTPRS